MRTVIKWFLMLVLLSLHIVLVGVVNYSFPSYDVTNITSGDVRRVDKDGVISASNPADGEIRDVYYLFTSNNATEKAIQYRNDNTGWGYPFYFKFNSGEIQARAMAFAEKKQTVQIKYYGWNAPMFNEERKLVSVQAFNEGDSKSLPIVSYILYAFFALTFFLGLQFIRGWFDSGK
ncbi:hypothetical protein A4G20_02760 [Pasteurellaceae bacterium RH1A]|nr:hypothetical protein A4G20_02760 [Pasteurellaceae bacterium RH1A]